ncbi:MAG: Spy/CpxP family protein refolding chaperone [Terriglobia bacterium]
MALILAGVLAVSALAAAQRPPRAPDRNPFGGSVFPPELVMRHQNEIGLSAEQRDAIRQEILAVQTQFTELQWQMQDVAEGMRALLDKERVDEDAALAQLDKILDTERQIKRLQIGLLVRIKNTLTPEQQAHLRELRGRGTPAPEAP